jgi:ketosteroid isomerase-like protein
VKGALVSDGRELLALETPGRALQSFAEVLSAGRLDAATSCFARDAYLLTPNATAVRGRDGIRSILAQLIADRTQVEVQAHSVLTVGSVALSSGRWTLRSASAGDSPFERACEPTVVLHRIEDAWKLAIAAPWR